MVTIKVIGGKGITVNGKTYRVGDTFTTDPFNASLLAKKVDKYQIVPASQIKKEA